MNSALGKNFTLTERVKLQFRAEMFNALNNVNLGGPDGNIESRNFGRILGGGAARVIQLNARLNC